MKKNSFLTMIPYNLQFFAEESGDNDDDTTPGADTDSDTGEVDIQAFAEIISEKDKKLDELTEEVNKLKKANADMLLRISSGKPDTFDFDKAILACDTRTISK